MLRQPKQRKRQTLNTLKFQANVYIYVVVPDIEYIKWYDGFGKLQINKYHTDVQFLIFLQIKNLSIAIFYLKKGLLVRWFFWNI